MKVVYRSLAPLVPFGGHGNWANQLLRLAEKIGEAQAVLTTTMKQTHTDIGVTCGKGRLHGDRQVHQNLSLCCILALIAFIIFLTSSGC